MKAPNQSLILGSFLIETILYNGVKKLCIEAKPLLLRDFVVTIFIKSFEKFDELVFL